MGCVSPRAPGAEISLRRGCELGKFGSEFAEADLAELRRGVTSSRLNGLAQRAPPPSRPSARSRPPRRQSSSYSRAAMRVLVVLAFRTGDKRTGEKYVAHIRAAIGAHTAGVHERVEVLVRTHAQLRAFLPPLPRPGEPPASDPVRHAITALDGIDLVFIDGEDTLVPWQRPAGPLLQLLHLCVTSAKPVLGCGPTLAMLAYLANVGPVPLRVRSGELHAFAPPAEPAGSGDAEAAEMPPPSRVDKRTGDVFGYVAERGGAWVAHANVGLRCAPRPDEPTGEGSRPTRRNRSDGVGCAEVAQLARFHFLFRDFAPGRFTLPQRNEWHAALRGAEAVRTPLGSFPLRGLAFSAPATPRWIMPWVVPASSHRTARHHSCPRGARTR